MTDVPLSPGTPDKIKGRLDLHVFFLLSEFSRTCGVSSPVCVPGISAFAAAALVLPGNYPYYLDLIHSLSVGPVLIGLAKFGIAFPVSYHTYNGIRHLVRSMIRLERVCASEQRFLVLSSKQLYLQMFLFLMPLLLCFSAGISAKASDFQR